MAFTVEDLINMFKEHDGSLPLIAFHHGEYVELPKLKLCLIHDQHNKPYGICVESDHGSEVHCNANFGEILREIEEKVRRKHHI